MVTWGITSLRFLIGVMEAGFVPGVLYVFTQ